MTSSPARNPQTVRSLPEEIIRADIASRRVNALPALTPAQIAEIKADGRHPDDMSSEWPLTSAQIARVKAGEV